jgi:C4-type Zn-finger protein
MADERECPMCGCTMRLKVTETTARIPGTPQSTKRATAEWICPDCDYFEEAEEDRS